MPVPYRVPVHDILRNRPGLSLRICYATRAEANRHWTFDFLRDGDAILPRSRLQTSVIRQLRRFRPEVVIITGYGPTYLLAFAWAVLNRRAVIVHTDGTLDSEQRLTFAHRAIRRLVGRRVDAFVGTGNGSKLMYLAQGHTPDQIFRSPLAVDNKTFRLASMNSGPPEFDFLFAGRLEEVKNPLFALHVARGVASRRGRPVAIAFLGAGPLEAELERVASRMDDVEVTFAGFVQHHALPDWFARASVFLFPTKWDPWGLVCNEAAAAGVPIVSSPRAGATDELVVRGEYGRSVDLDLANWVAAADELLQQRASGTTAPSGIVENEYTFELAAAGLSEAIDAAVRRRSSRAK